MSDGVDLPGESADTGNEFVEPSFGGEDDYSSGFGEPDVSEDSDEEGAEEEVIDEETDEEGDFEEEEGAETEESTEEEGEAESEKSPEDKKFELRMVIDGKETTMSMDSEEIVKHVQKGIVADKRLEAASQQKKLVEQFMDRLTGDPMTMLKKMNWDAETLLDTYIDDFMPLIEAKLDEQIRYENMTPEEKQREDFRREQEAFRKQQQETNAKNEQFQRQQFRQAEAQRYHMGINNAMTANGLDVNDPQLRRQFVIEGEAYLSADQDPDFDAIAKKILNSTKELSTKGIGTLSVEELAKTLSKEQMAQLAKMRVEEHKKNTIVKKPKRVKKKAAARRGSQSDYSFSQMNKDIAGKLKMS